MKYDAPGLFRDLPVCPACGKGEGCDCRKWCPECRCWTNHTQHEDGIHPDSMEADGLVV